MTDVTEPLARQSTPTAPGVGVESVPAPRVLTAPGELHEVPPELRSLLCYLDTGVLMVRKDVLLDQHVLSFVEDLRRDGKDCRKQPCSLADLQRVYEQAAASSPGKLRDGKESDTQRRVKDILRHCVAMGASDLHIIGGQNICRIKVRVNGLLEDYAPLPQLPVAAGAELRSSIYTSMCDLADPIYIASKPQDARIGESHVKEIGLYGARVATRPLDKGQLMVLRLLAQRNETWTLEQLGYLPEQQALIHEMTQNKHGIQIFAGATGSGKSTSLQVLISMLIRNFNEQLHVLTLENPAEYEIAGANQTPVIGDDWVGGIKNAMRLDPDVIMIGEMRDFSSAQAAFQAALTGHGVWTTLHANDPFAILQRLDDLKLDPGLYGDASLVRGLIYQCLVPVLCKSCRIPLRVIEQGLDKGLRERLAEYCEGGDIFFRNEQGCPHCRKGIKGRSVVAEVVDPTQEELDVFRKEGKQACRSHWVKHAGGITRTAHLARLISAGLVDPRLGEKMVSRLDADKRVMA